MGIGYDYRKCIGLKVKPRQGDGLLFYSVFPNGTIDRVMVLFFRFYMMPVCSLTVLENASPQILII